MKNLDALFEVIGALARRRYQLGEKYFSRVGLNHSEARLLRLLQQEKGSATQEALSSKLFIDRSNAGRALKNLEQGGYITRRQDDADKRAKLLQITKKGKEAVAEIAKSKDKIVKEFFGELKDGEAGMILELLKKVPQLDL